MAWEILDGPWGLGYGVPMNTDLQKQIADLLKVSAKDVSIRPDGSGEVDGNFDVDLDQLLELQELVGRKVRVSWREASLGWDDYYAAIQW